MKKIFHILFVLVVVFTFSSCGSDDEKERKYFNGDCKQTVSLESGPANSSITTKDTSPSLDEMLQNATGYGYPVIGGELHVNGENTAVKVVGLPDGVILKNFSLKINGSKKEYGDIDVTRTNLYTGNSSYFEQVFASMIKNKKLITEVTFTPTEKISADVKLEIVFSGRFSYWQKK